jgi:CheY-like chemotaxis protein
MAIRVMLFNDRREILELFEQIIPSDEYELTLFSYGIDEIGVIAAQPPDLIVLDFVVGREVDGWSLLEKIKMIPAIADTPVIICVLPTRAVKEIEGFLATQEVIVVPKPFKANTLVEAFQKALLLSSRLAPKKPERKAPTKRADDGE